MADRSFDRVSVVRPYPEGAILAIERALTANGVSVAVFGLRSRFGAVLARGLPAAQRRRFQQRVAQASLGSTDLRLLASVHEDIRLASTLVPSLAFVRSRVMWFAQHRLSALAARHLHRSQADEVVIAMPHAAMAAFHASNGLKVLHVVNGHPKSHNDALKVDHLAVPRAELVPTREVRVVDAEMAMADLILVPSTAVESSLIDAGVDASKIRRVPYGVAQGFFDAATTSVERDVPFAYVGQISYRKGVDTIIAAAAQAPEIKVLLAGPIVSASILRKLPDNVSYLGALSRQDTMNLLSRTETLLIPSREDAYPLVALEALAAGCRLIASDAIGTLDLIRDQPGVVVVKPGSASDLLNALLSKLPSLQDEVQLKPWTWEEYGEAVFSEIGKRLARSQ